VLRHHDLPWQRPQFERWTVADDPAWAHVAINELSRAELAGRGIDAIRLYNRFPLDGWSEGEREGVRAGLGLSGPVLLHPVRAIPRKDVPAAVRLAEARAMTYWLTGAAEDGYEDELAAVLSAATCPVVRGGVERAADMYAAADLVALTSTVEGFGNPLIESALARRPIVVRPYPVAAELASAFGFRWFEDEGDVDANEAIARASFGLDGLPAELAAVLERVL
jgi:glycosyltransferase involved in cell wall biosynthesis